MADYSFTHTNTSVTFVVTGISEGDSVRFYVRYDPNPGSLIVDQIYEATGNTMTQTFSVLSAGNSYAVNVAVNGTRIGTQYFNTSVSRPSIWSWTSTIASGSAIKIGFQEWNSFCARINAFRVYKGLAEYDFAAVVSGQAISAAIVNQAITAINAIPGHGTLPASAVAGVTKISAAFFNQLRDALNAVS